MIDPVTIGLVVSGVKTAYGIAQEAIEAIKKARELGHDAVDCMPFLGSFFTAQGQVEAAVKEAQTAKLAPKPVTEDGSPADPVSARSDTEVALEAMMMSRKLKADEEFIKDFLIYQCSDSGLYTELCERRDAIANARAAEEEAIRRAATERILEEKRKLMAIRRARQKRIDMVTDALSVIVGLAACSALIYGIFWMFTIGGK